MAYDDILEPSTEQTTLEDILIQRSLRYFDRKPVRADEKYYVVGLEVKSHRHGGKTLEGAFSLHESMSELCELAGTGGLTVVGSTYQLVTRPHPKYYLGPGKVKEIERALQQLQCTCVLLDAQLYPSLHFTLQSHAGGDHGG